MKTWNLALALALTTTVGLGAIALRQGAVQLGNIELDGGTETVEVDTSAIPSGSGPHLTGKFTNKTGEEMTDVTISLVKDKEDPSATIPEGGDTDVAGTSIPGSPTSSGTKANTEFGPGAGKPKKLGDNGSYDFDVDVTDTGSGSTIYVKLTPSKDDRSPDPSAHADVLALFDLSGNSPGKTNALDDPTHDRAYARITNVDRNGDDLVGLAGEVNFDPADSLTISSVGIYQLSNDLAVAGATVGVTGNEFEITGFTDLKPAESYYLSVVFSGVPSAQYTIELLGDF